jgi:hypothetical protein
MEQQKEVICEKIKNNISNLNQNELEEIFKIIYKSNNNYTKNNSGILLNLSTMNDDLLEQIDNYINFCIKSHKEINKYEVLCNNFSDVINTKEKVEDTYLEIANKNKQKISSYMKFYLLKKKFAKQTATVNNKNDKTLTHEEYLINS